MESPLQQYNTAFRDLLAQLNPAQARAVRQTEGPVLVIAGPGTGKTQVLATRIGAILLETDARPQNILCLTFTDAGARAMRERLLDMIGPEAHRVPVFTFHAFCNRIIQENLEIFGRGDIEPLSELERVEMIREMLEQLDPEHPLRSGKKQAFFYEQHLSELFSNMKKEGWTAGLVRRAVDVFLRELPQNEAFIYQKNNKFGKKGEPKTAKVLDITEKMERLKAAADLYPKFQYQLERKGRYEYEDMLLWVLKAFEAHEALLRQYQERCQYILVDEYQDTNGAQNQLIGQLINFWEAPNVFIVGDDDQSIYEFQGARLRNLIEFYHKHQPALLTVLLETNYRSSQNILDAASRLIAHNEMRAVMLLDKALNDKKLQAFQDAEGEALVHVYESHLHETADVAARIASLLQSGVPPDEIAVLYARHKNALRLMQWFDKKNIPYSTKRPVNLLDLPLIQQLRDLLRYVQDELQAPYSGDYRLFRLLHASWWNLHPLDIAELAIDLRRENEAFFRNAGKKVPGMPMAPFHAPREVLRALNQWIADATRVSLPAWMEQLYRETGILHWAFQQPDKIWWLQVLHTFLDFINREVARNPRFSLDRLLRLLDNMDDNHLPLELLQQVRPGGGVQLRTAHAAKGLEYEYVFLIDCTTEDWEPGARQNSRRFALPESLTYSGEEDAEEARRRLFYVAMTRAKHHLYLSYSQSDWSGKALEQTRFVDETGLPKIHLPANPALMTELQIGLLLEPAQPNITLPEKDRLDALLADFSLNVTALNRYLRCPIAFYYSDVLRIPEAMREDAAYGIAMHEALRQFFNQMKNGAPPPTQLVALFEQQMAHFQGYFSPHGFLQRKNLGSRYLNRYALEQVPYWRKRAVVERKIDRVEINGVPISGVIDKIEWTDQGIRLVDYKTGAPDAKKLAPPNDAEPYGGVYWRQLLFYQLLIEASRVYPEKVVQTSISWLEPDKKGNFVYSDALIEPENLSWMRALIEDTWQKIQARAFSTGCGRPDCSWCAMHRNRDMSVSLSGEEDGLDD